MVTSSPCSFTPKAAASAPTVVAVAGRRCGGSAKNSTFGRRSGRIRGAALIAIGRDVVDCSRAALLSGAVRSAAACGPVPAGLLGARCWPFIFAGSKGHEDSGASDREPFGMALRWCALGSARVETEDTAARVAAEAGLRRIYPNQKRNAFFFGQLKFVLTLNLL